MTTEQAEKLIASLQKKHRLFKMLGFQAHDKGVFMTFEQIDIDMKTISHWIDCEGYYALYVGSQGTGDRRVMVAEIRS